MKKNGSDSLAMLPWFPKDFIAATRHLSLAERGAYRDLLDYQWELGALPVDKLKLARLLGVTPKEFDAVWPAIAMKFAPSGGGLQNQRLEQHRKTALDLRAKRSQGARLTNAQRYGDRGAERNGKRLAQRGGQRYAQRVAQASPPSPSPSSSSLPHPLPGGGDRAGESRRQPRASRARSLAAWRLVIDAVDRVAHTPGLSWTRVREELEIDAFAWSAIEDIGGCGKLSQRSQFTERSLRDRFRTAYERRAAGQEDLAL